jgi:hypothetical protein
MKPVGNALPLNLFFPTHSVLFPSALLWSIDGLFVLQNTLKCMVFHSLPINIINCIKFYVNCSACLIGNTNICLFVYMQIISHDTLYKSLHQSFFYSFITILPSESGATLHYSTILSYILWFRQMYTFTIVELPKLHQCSGVMVSMLVSSVVDRGCGSRLGQTKDY